MQKSAGSILLVKFSNQWHILLTHAAGNWKNKKMGIPKGLIENDEEPYKTAIRETLEETGLKIKILNTSPILTLETGHKIVYCFFSYLYDSELEKIDEKLRVKSIDRSEIDYARFYTLDRAEELIYEYQKPVIEIARNHVRVLKMLTILEAKNYLRK